MLLCAVLLGCGACANGVPLRSLQPDRLIQWSSPKSDGVAWVKNIEDSRDAGISRGLWKRVADFVFGESDTSIVKPYGVLMDDQDHLYVVDVALKLVHVMDTRDNSYRVIGRKSQERLLTPIALAVDGGGNLYISDSEAGAVYRYNLASGAFTLFAGDLQRPTGLAWHPQKKQLYVSETAAHRIVVFDQNGQTRRRIGRRGEGSGEFNFPTDLLFDAQGALYVTDSLNDRIQKLTAEGKFISRLGVQGDGPGEFLKPKGIAVDSRGALYVCDALRDSVQVFEPSGQFRLEFGERGQGAGKFWMPSGIFIDREDVIYVSDTYNRRIQLFKRVGPRRQAEEETGAGPGQGTAGKPEVSR